ncbi:MAG: hypothetical protein IPP14_07205 [Planctomycetes bacterium]|nr:hypothetical protein [Planctomycetota bacterium]
MHGEQAYLFQHALLRDAAYALQPPSERTILHALAGEILSVEPDAQASLAAEIADHAREALDSARELHYLTLAADYAARVYDLDLEAQLCRRAGASAACGPRQAAEWNCRAGRVLMARGRQADAEPLLHQSLAAALHCQDTSLELSIRLRLCELWARTARRAEAMEAIPALVERARGINNPRLLADAELALDDLHDHRGELEHGAQALQRALEIARAIGDIPLQSRVTSTLAYRLHRLGQTAKAESMTRDGLALPGSDVVGRAALLNSLGVICVETSRLDEAEAAYRESLGLCTQAGRRLTVAGLLGNLANLEYYFRGNLAKAGRQYARARDVYMEAGDVESAARNARMAGSTEYAAGRRADAAVHFESAIRLSEMASLTDNLLDSRRFLALCRQDTLAGYDALPELLQVAARCIELGHTRTTMISLCDIGRRLLAAGMPVAAARALAMATPGPGQPVELGAVGPRRMIGQLLGWPDVPAQQRQELRRGMPAGDTPHHYVVLTLWPDLCQQLLVLHGPDGTGHVRNPAAQGRQQCQALLDEIDSLVAGRAGAYHAARVALADARLAMAESDSAVLAGRPAMLFRGMRLDGLTPLCRAGLGQQLRAQSPDAFHKLCQSNPALAAQLSGPAPHWADTDLPEKPLAQLEAAMAGPPARATRT